MKISQRILLSALFIPHFITAQCPNRPNASLRLLTNDICFGSSVTAINSSDENGNDVYYIWEWGDNTRDTVNDKSSKTHTYNQPINFCTSVSAGGIDYKITLKMVNRNLQCFSHASTSEVFIYAPPQTNFTFDDVCIFNPIVSFKDATCPITNRDAIYTWDFGDPPSGVNNTSNVVNPKHTYPGIGNYSVKLTVSTFCGERTMIKKIRVLSDPIAQVSYTEQPLYCLPYDITFNNTSLNGTGNTWQVTPDVGYIFTNGTDKTSQNPTFRFL